MNFLSAGQFPLVSEPDQPKTSKDARISSTFDREQYEEEKRTGERRENGALCLKKLKPVHHEMIALHLDGVKNKAIAQEFGVTDTTVSLVLSDPLSQKIITAARQEHKERFANLYGKVVDVIEDAVSDAESIDVRLKGASLYLRENTDSGGDSKETAEDVIQKIINMQINGDIIVQGG